MASGKKIPPVEELRKCIIVERMTQDEVANRYKVSSRSVKRWFRKCKEELGLERWPLQKTRKMAVDRDADFSPPQDDDEWRTDLEEEITEPTKKKRKLESNSQKLNHLLQRIIQENEQITPTVYKTIPFREVWLGNIHSIDGPWNSMNYLVWSQYTPFTLSSLRGQWVCGNFASISSSPVSEAELKTNGFNVIQNKAISCPFGIDFELNLRMRLHRYLSSGNVVSMCKLLHLNGKDVYIDETWLQWKQWFFIMCKYSQSTQPCLIFDESQRFFFNPDLSRIDQERQLSLTLDTYLPKFNP